ncbi:unnamed protein product [Durusdinium trenchii]|uniref:Uncharacterized protein n=2 Tax=Durusdinium trenchii TaxID=1381693 RepID=A0ABP0I3Y7_9DINO
MNAVASQLAKMTEALPKEISSTAWAFAKVSYDGAIYHTIGKIAESKISQCDAQSLSNLVWVFATVLICPQPLILSISQAAFQCLHTFGAQELANTVWAFTRLLFIERSLCDAISQMCISKIESFVSQRT